MRRREGWIWKKKVRKRIRGEEKDPKGLKDENRIEERSRIRKRRDRIWNIEETDWEEWEEEKEGDREATGRE